MYNKTALNRELTKNQILFIMEYCHRLYKYIKGQGEFKIQIVDWVEYERSLVKGIVLLRSICLDSNTDICLVVYDNEYETVYMSILEFFHFDTKASECKGLDMEDFLSIYEHAVYAENNLAMFDSRIFSEILEKFKSNHKIGVNNTTDFFKNYNFTTLKKYMDVNKTTKDLIIL